MNVHTRKVEPVVSETSHFSLQETCMLFCFSHLWSLLAKATSGWYSGSEPIPDKCLFETGISCWTDPPLSRHSRYFLLPFIISRLDLTHGVMAAAFSTSRVENSTYFWMWFITNLDDQKFGVTICSWDCKLPHLRRAAFCPGQCPDLHCPRLW